MVKAGAHEAFCKKYGISRNRADGLTSFQPFSAEGNGEVEILVYRNQIMRCKTLPQWKAKLKVIFENEDIHTEIKALADLGLVFNYIWDTAWPEIEV
jgi:hypothetical protein